MTISDPIQVPRFWAELSASLFAELNFDEVVAVLPLGATEQHGPHLPVGVDTQIAKGMVHAVVERLPDISPVMFLPTIEVSNSVEHTDKAGTLSLGRNLTFELILALARDVKKVGVRKLVMINAHGGNVGVMVDAAHAVRAELGMLCVYTNWMRLGLPDGLIEPDQKTLDIHGGHLETSLMMALHPDLVANDEVANFTNLQRDLAARFDLLRAYGPIGFGWMADDLNSSGALGEASSANAGDGSAIIAHQAERMVSLLHEVERFQPDWQR